MKTILIVEDDPIIRRLNQYLFSKAGFQVELAADGEEAIRMLDASRPDIALVDLMLPKVHGIEVIRQIRARPHLGNVPVIVFTNAYLSSMVRAAWRAGANGCLTKADCTEEQLLEAVCNALEKAAQRSSPPASEGLPEAPAGAAPAAPTAPASGAAKPPEVAAPSIPSSPSASPAIEAEAQKPLSADVIRSMLLLLPQVVSSFREAIAAFDQRRVADSLLPTLLECYPPLHALTGQAGLVGLGQIACLAGALEALLKELQEEPESLSASALRTASEALELVAQLLRCPPEVRHRPLPPALVLAVDDEVICRQAVMAALDLAQLKAIVCDHPVRALQLLEENTFDLVFLNVDMPEMNGFELCVRLRALPRHQITPVVFVTGLANFENQARSMMCGGNEFIAKPFLPTELAVKALTLLLRGHGRAPRSW
jgi:CheY-like chemotaxis protein